MRHPVEIRIPWRPAALAGSSAMAMQVGALLSGAALLAPGRATLVVPQAARYALGDPGLLLLAIYYAGLLLLLHFVPLAWFGRGVLRVANLCGARPPRPTALFLLMLVGFLAAMAWAEEVAPESGAVADNVVLGHPVLAGFLRWLAWPAIAVMLYGVPGHLPPRRRWWVGGAALSLAWGASFAAAHMDGSAAVAPNKPHVILIGLDSVRADFVPLADASGPLMPFLGRIKPDFVDFKDAETPLARTGASWAAVLSGRYPVHSGMRFNLQPREMIDDAEWLPKLMRQAGYKTGYVTDDSRFSNLDRSYGFDVTSHPPIGLQDFLFGTLSDFVPFNLLRSTPLGPHFLPHAWGNRAAHHGYQPAESSSRVEELLDAVDPGPPLFLVAHLCIAHYPYMSPELEGITALQGDPELASQRDVLRYAAALRATDDQLGRIWSSLAARGYLDNALVFILSDHGESLALGRDQLIAQEAGEQRTGLSVGLGHGTVGLSDAQYKTVLLMQRFVDGKPVYAPQAVDSPASLVDIAPTVLKAVGGRPVGPMDGLDLVALAQGATEAANRVRFRETDLRGDVLNTAELDPNRIVEEFAKMFELTPDGRVQIRRAGIDGMLMDKQRVAHRGGRYLLHDPDSPRRPWLMYSRANRSAWTPRFASQEEIDLRDALCGHWERDEGFWQVNCGAGNRPGPTAGAR